MQLPDEANETGSSVDPSWEDVVELVNLRGDETTVYLLTFLTELIHGRMSPGRSGIRL